MELGPTPCEANDLVAGMYRVSIRLDGYREFSKDIAVSTDARKSIKVKLAPLVGGLTVLSTPTGARLSLNGADIGVTPYDTAQLKPGRYALRCMLDQYLPDSVVHSVTAGRHDTLTIRLLNEDSVKAVRALRKRRGRIARRMVFGAFTAGFGIAGLVMNGQTRGYIEDEDKARDNYNRDGLTASEYDRYWQEYNDARDKASEASTTRNWLYAIAGAFSIGVVIPFWPLRP